MGGERDATAASRRPGSSEVPSAAPWSARKARRDGGMGAHPGSREHIPAFLGGAARDSTARAYRMATPLLTAGLLDIRRDGRGVGHGECAGLYLDTAPR